MPLFLTERESDLIEHMDRKDCDPELLENTYRQFKTINWLLSGWEGIYKKYLRPRMHPNESYTLLDIGFGGGDIPLLISKLAKRDGFDLHITAIETDERAFKFSKALTQDEKVLFRHCSSKHMLNYGDTFDFVISNHLIHHLDEFELTKILRQAEELATRMVLFSDIERSDVGYSLFSVFAPILFRKSFIVEDGLMSIRKSFTKSELERSIPNNWTVSRQFPFRLILKWPR